MVDRPDADGRAMRTTREMSSTIEAEDIFVLRRVSDDQMINFDGVGRGEGWAGNITIDPVRDPLICQALVTSLCQQVAERIGSQAAQVLATGAASA